MEPLSGQFGALWGHLEVTLGHFEVTLGSLWVTLGSNPVRIRVWTAPSAKNIVKPMDLSPVGVRAAALVRDNVLKVEYPKKLNFHLIFTFRSPFSMKHTGQRFEGRVAQNVSEILNFWDTLPSKSCPV